MKTGNLTMRVVKSALIVSVGLGAVGYGTFSAFSSTTENPGNSFASGTVVIGDNDGDTALYSVSNAKPTQSSTAKCITVTYTGSLGANVKLFRGAFTGGDAAFRDTIDLTVTKGSGGTFADCTGFTAASSNPSVYNAKLGAFPAGGISVTDADGNATWSQNDAVTYRVQATLPDTSDNNLQGKGTGTHSFTWEATSN